MSLVARPGLGFTECVHNDSLLVSVVSGNFIALPAY
jgi:hypothetical protein